ncbi:hypothetical protein PM724_12740 [Erysipelatoclostridium ramosum]|uniref:hypothetical protein n=1 Tax=Thomasclavelia ramosa TaxID=1547 RepID=UPI0018AC786C|nr:hypothetical protein [Thomasclavelia ramosa]MDB7094788.1 hypothetical protein [Thomasclavelia ramosa]
MKKITYIFIELFLMLLIKAARQLQAIYIRNVKRLLGTIMTIWKDEVQYWRVVFSVSILYNIFNDV